MKLIFPKTGTFYVSAGQNTILTWPKEHFNYRNPFDSDLIMINLNSRKQSVQYMYTILYLLFITITITICLPGFLTIFEKVDEVKNAGKH